MNIRFGTTNIFFSGYKEGNIQVRYPNKKRKVEYNKLKEQ